MTKKLKRGPAPLTVGDLHYIAKLKEQGRVWRSEPPDRPGWWWVDTLEGVYPAEVDEHGQAWACGGFPVEGATRWAGPIPEPVELEEGL